MKPTQQEVMQWVFESGLDVRVRQIVELAYQAGMEQGKADYERENLRHTVALPDSLNVVQDQVAEACAKMCDKRRRTVSLGNGLSMWSHGEASVEASYCAEHIRAGEWLKYMEGK